MSRLSPIDPISSSAGTTRSHFNNDARSGEVGGRFDFDDGGTYCGGWEDGKAHGHGVCTGPKGQGEYSGSWHYGFEVSGVYTWPSGSSYEGHWQNGKRHGLGVETRGRWIYRGEWTQGLKGRYGVRQSTVSSAKYEGTWANGLQDGYGSETYADAGTYQGQWLRGMRHGYGVRTSAPFGIASHCKIGDARHTSISSLNLENESGHITSPNTENRDNIDSRGGFVLRSRSDEVPHRRRSLVERTGMKNFVQSLKLKKQRSTGDLDRKVGVSIRSTGSSTSWMSSESSFVGGGGGGGTGAASIISEGSNQSFVLEDELLDSNITETYMGEWKNDKRCGFGISERSDGLKYEGEWYNNRKYGYGITTQKDGIREEGKYKNNILITSHQKRHLFLIRSAKFRERIDSAINAAQRASKIAMQKADIAISRTATARGKAEQADIAEVHAKEDADTALLCAKNYSHETDKLQPNSSVRASRSPSFQNVPPQPQFPPTGGATKPPATPTFPVENTSLNVSLNGAPQSKFLEPNVPNHIKGRDKSPSFSNFPTFPQQQQQSQHQQQQTPKLTTSQLSDIKNSLVPEFNKSPVQSIHQQIQLPNVSEYQEPPIETVVKEVKPELHSGIHTSTSNRSFNFPSTNCDIKIDRSVGGAENQIFSSSSSPPLPPPSPMSQASPASRLADALRKTKTSMQQPLLQQQHHQQPQQHHQQQQRQQPGGHNSRNFSRIMDDRLDHYNRTPSRQPSVEHMNLPSSLSENKATASSSRASSRTRALPPVPSMSIDDSTNFVDGLRNRLSGAVNSQEISHMGNIPKRTESLYFKEPIQPEPSRGPESGAASLQRKKSLPDVQSLVGVTKSQGSTEMTREEISLLSSTRRDVLRKQLEEIEKYKSNPLLYFVSPTFKDWVSRQQLILLILFVNLTLALIFFKILT
ncbi:uncharacterized protein jp [Lepeophtheirus salmonis]|uniref:uncharacterized protein jp n=1 Tax=Lepeophtheirus salmonis TaxID=72036 RepID=UPI001AE463D4|nr:junctophilin-1-like [Lepeophtheirus salmonis]